MSQTPEKIAPPAESPFEDFLARVKDLLGAGGADTRRQVVRTVLELQRMLTERKPS